MPGKIRKHALTLPEEGELVERASPGAAPSAFRIWQAGENVCDDGPVFFTAKSAELLMAEQAARGRAYSFDFDHLSLTTDRPATAGRAAGWHQLEVRPGKGGAPELWAVAIEWCDDARAGLEAKHWRFFSPAFVTDEASQVVGYINCALCINPLTHQLPSLASVRAAAISGATMDKKALLAALATLASPSSGEEEKKEAAAALAAHFDSEDGDKDGKKDDEPEAKADGDEPKDEEPKEEEEPRQEAKAKAARSSKAALDLARDNQRLAARLDARDKADLIASRDDLAPGVVAWLKAQPLATVKSFVATTPRAVEGRKAGITQGDQSEAEVEHPVDRAFGIVKAASHVGLGAPRNGLRLLSFRKGA